MKTVEQPDRDGHGHWHGYRDQSRWFQIASLSDSGGPYRPGTRRDRDNVYWQGPWPPEPGTVTRAVQCWLPSH
jgi:hypothetical protein